MKTTLAITVLMLLSLTAAEEMGRHRGMKEAQTLVEVYCLGAMNGYLSHGSARVAPPASPGGTP